MTYNGLDLFSSGPSQVVPGPIQSRDAVAQIPGAIGSTIIGQGLSSRMLTQNGTLRGDNEPELRERIDAIQSLVGTGAAELVDELGNRWPACVMREYKADPVYKIGPRFAIDYTLTYLQTTP